MRQKRPMASDRAKPRMAYENSCCFSEGFLEGTLSCISLSLYRVWSVQNSHGASETGNYLA